MQIKSLTERDIPAFIELWNQNYEVLTSSNFLMTYDKALAGFKQKMFDYFGLFDRDKLVGFALYKDIMDDTWLKHLLIGKKFRKKGNGALLLGETLKKYPKKKVKTEVLFSNVPAKKFFIKNGFRLVKEDYKNKQFILLFRTP